MKTIGIIAEFNPFHNGHAHLITEAKRKCGADRCVVVMSGAFTQRGVPACVYKYDRVLSALNNGVDVVLELPVSYATATAETFAFGGVSILNALGCIDMIVFGSECGDIDILRQIAYDLANPADSKKDLINTYLSKGLTYPAARANAYPEYMDILNDPNNILGIEYLKALIRLKSDIEPFTIERTGSNYHDVDINHYASAKAIREVLKSYSPLSPADNLDMLLSIQNCMPGNTFDYLKRNLGQTSPVFLNDMRDLVNYTLISSSAEELSQYQDMNIDIARRLSKLSGEYNSLEDMIESLKTKELTYTRLSRCILHTVLKLRDLTRDDSNTLVPTPYSRILGFRKESSDIMHEISHKASIPLITKPADAGKIIPPEAMPFFEATIQADKLYSLLLQSKLSTEYINSMKISPVIV